MDHSIRAVIGASDLVAQLAGSWHFANAIALPQGMAMVLVTDALLDDMIELADRTGAAVFPQFEHLVPALEESLRSMSHVGALAYVETGYFERTGSQAAILYLRQKVLLGPLRQETTHAGVVGESAINAVLRLMGVRCTGSDEFDALELGKYRRMPST